MSASLILLGYLVGSVPFAFLVVWRLAGIDLRLAGSGNVGASNVLRMTGASLGVLVAALDLAKGSAAVLFAGGVGADVRVQAATGVAAIVGHVYPVWLRFKGGKGVATACGVFAVLAPPATALAAALFALTVWLTRYVSLGSIVGIAVLAPMGYATDVAPPVLIAALITAGLVIYRHRSNLERLQSGTERRIGEPRDTG
jgi:glycerol-3-phosphate acyltransferase PlsY